jgi:hypothetical protein
MMDDDLKQVLEAWKAPRPAPDLLARTRLRFRQQDVAWWKRFAAPALAAAAGCVVLIAAAFLLVSMSVETGRTKSGTATFSLNGFQPVDTLRPEVIRRPHVP